MLYMIKSVSNKLYLKKQLYELHITKGTAVLEHLNFFNKIISEFLTVDVKIDEEDKALILLSSPLQSYDTSLPSCSMVRKLSFWRRSRQLSYLKRSVKDQIKLSRKDRVWWP